MLTKSLHTVTAAANVARLINSGNVLFVGTVPVTNKSHTPSALAKLALAVLGYDVDTSARGCAADETVRRCVEACAKVLTEVQS